MFGANAITKKFQEVDGSLLVNDVFLTIQGEGPDAGRPAVFVRLSKCNLRCFFCDTEFETGTQMTFPQIRERVLKLLQLNTCDLVVITGGEPMLQNFLPLVMACNAVGVGVSVETSGSVWLDGLGQFFGPNREGNNLIVCSPKTPKIHEKLIPLIGAYKYIVGVDNISPIDGLPIRSTQRKGEKMEVFRAPEGAPIYVQACDEQDPALNQANLETAAAIAMQFGFRLSVQIHKLVGLP